MEEDDRPGLEKCFKEALEHVRETGLLHPSDLQLPIQASPPTSMLPTPGYQGGTFDPQQIGVACIVVPPPEGRAPYSLGDWGLHTVRAPPLLPDLPFLRQQLHFVDKASSRA